MSTQGDAPTSREEAELLCGLRSELAEKIKQGVLRLRTCIHGARLATLERGLCRSKMLRVEEAQLLWSERAEKIKQDVLKLGSGILSIPGVLMWPFSLPRYIL